MNAVEEFYLKLKDIHHHALLEKRGSVIFQGEGSIPVHKKPTSYLQFKSIFF